MHVETIAVLGAGQMGAGIAEVSANNGMHVVLKDHDEEGLGKGKLHIVFCINPHTHGLENLTMLVCGGGQINQCLA